MKKEARIYGVENNPILNPKGYVPIANGFWTNIACVGSIPGAFRLFFFVVSRTICWQGMSKEKGDFISCSQIAKGLGMKRGNVPRLIRGAVSLNLITATVAKNSRDNKNEYFLTPIMDIGKWKVGLAGDANLHGARKEETISSGPISYAPPRAAHYALVKVLEDHIRKIDPTHVFPPRYLAIWANVFSRIERQSGICVAEIERILRWAMDHEYWGARMLDAHLFSKRFGVFHRESGGLWMGKPLQATMSVPKNRATEEDEKWMKPRHGGFD